MRYHANPHRTCHLESKVNVGIPPSHDVSQSMTVSCPLDIKLVDVRVTVIGRLVVIAQPRLIQELIVATPRDTRHETSKE